MGVVGRVTMLEALSGRGREEELSRASRELISKCEGRRWSDDGGFALARLGTGLAIMARGILWAMISGCAVTSTDRLISFLVLRCLGADDADDTVWARCTLALSRFSDIKSLDF